MPVADQGKWATGITKKLDDESSARARSPGPPVRRPHLLESSTIPASALYHARNEVSSPKKPPALMMGGFGASSLLRCRYPRPSSRKVRSSDRKRKKKASVDRRVARRSRVVKMNQPWEQRISRGSAPASRPHGRAYHQEEAKRVVKRPRAARRLDGGRDVEPAGRQGDGKGQPEPAVRGQRRGTKGVSHRHFPGNRLATRCPRPAATDRPHHMPDSSCTNPP